jgi:hypothetical protein
MAAFDRTLRGAAITNAGLHWVPGPWLSLTPNPLPQAGEGADGGFWLNVAGRHDHQCRLGLGARALAFPHPNPLPQTGEGADGGF